MNYFSLMCIKKKSNWLTAVSKSGGHYMSMSTNAIWFCSSYISQNMYCIVQNAYLNLKMSCDICDFFMPKKISFHRPYLWQTSGKYRSLNSACPIIRKAILAFKQSNPWKVDQLETMSFILILWWWLPIVISTVNS